MSTHVELNADAHRKIILAVNCSVLLVSASSISTPLAFFLSLSYISRVTMENGRRVRLPVFTAAGNVDDCVLKYPPYGQPSQHLSLYWQPTLPSIGFVRFATRPMIIRR